MPPLLTCPVGASIPSRFVVWMWDWTPKGVRWAINSTPRRTDVARSGLLWTALQAGRDCWQWDSDVISPLSYDTLLSFIQEDIRDGYDAIVAPTAGMNGKVLLLPAGEVDRNKAFPIDGPLCGMFYITAGALAKLKPIAIQEGIMGEKHPMYCTYGIHEGKSYSEDMDLAYRARQVGLRLGADPRLVMRHMAKMDAVVVP